jgi:hypothetical protein
MLLLSVIVRASPGRAFCGGCYTSGSGGWSVNRREFELLRDLPDKRITEDIRFVASRATEPNLTFSGIILENSARWTVRVNGTYKPEIPALTFNFSIPDVGPICRIDMNGPIHKPVGRTHKHSLKQDDDPGKNLPNPDAAPDFENLSPSEAWALLCDRAKIIHVGAFIDPSGAA